jgi:hypothetical protein
MDKKDRNIEGLNDEGWITDLAFLVDKNSRLNDVNKYLQSKSVLLPKGTTLSQSS